MKRPFEALGAAFGYFSILPVGRIAKAAPPDGAALVALPIVGAAIGALAGAVGLAASYVAPAPLRAALTLGTLVALSGAVHLDGFLDGCDALVASVPPERRHEILKDPHHGTFALTGLAVVASIWLASLEALPPRASPASLAFAGALARAAILPCAFAFPDARSEAREPAFAQPHAVALLSGETALLMLAGLSFSPRTALLVPAALLAAAATLRWCADRLGGGLVGDAYGFVIVPLEVAILTSLVIGRSQEAGRASGDE